MKKEKILNSFLEIKKELENLKNKHSLKDLKTKIQQEKKDIETKLETKLLSEIKKAKSFLNTQKKSIDKLQKKYKEKIAIERLGLKNYFRAEEYHQKYLDKNPNGYCHIHPDKFKQAENAKEIH